MSKQQINDECTNNTAATPRYKQYTSVYVCVYDMEYAAQESFKEKNTGIYTKLPRRVMEYIDSTERLRQEEVPQRYVYTSVPPNHWRVRLP